MPTAAPAPALSNSVQSASPNRSGSILRIGFVALADAAPIIAAHELGFFEQQGLRVQLIRELGWASIRDKILFRELDAAHALGAMPLTATLGLDSPAIPCAASRILSAHGNAVTIAQKHWDNGVRDNADLADFIQQRSRSQPLTFGVVFPCSSHHFLIRQWMRSIGVDPDREVRIVILPPPQLFRNLRSGTIDGYCVGEPWNSLAVKHRVGWVAAVSAELAPGHPEKVLMLRRDFIEQDLDRHEAILRALDASARFCQAAKNRHVLTELLARREYLNCPREILLPAFAERFDFGNGQVRDVRQFHRFEGPEFRQPDPAQGAWLLKGLIEAGLVDAEAAADRKAQLETIYGPHPERRL